MSKESYFAKTLIRKKHGPSVTATKKTEFASYAFKIINKTIIQHERMPRIRYMCVQTASGRRNILQFSNKKHLNTMWLEILYITQSYKNKFQMTWEISRLWNIFYCDQMCYIHLNTLMNVSPGQCHRDIIGTSKVVPGFTGNLFRNEHDFL